MNVLTLRICILQSDDDAVVFQALKSGSRIFSHYLEKRDISYYGVKDGNGNFVSLKRGKKKVDAKQDKSLQADAQYTVRVALRKSYFIFSGRLLELLYHEEVGLQLPALKALMDFELLAGQSDSDAAPKFANVWLPWIVAVIAHTYGESEELTTEFIDTYFKLYDDVRLFTFQACAGLISAYDPENKAYYNSEKNEDLILPKRMPYLKKENDFNFGMFELMISAPMAGKKEDLNCFWVQPDTHDSGDDSGKTKSTSNDKKRKRADFGLDDSDDMDLDNIGLDSDGDDDGEAAPHVHRDLLDLNLHKAAFAKGWLALMARKLEPKLHIKILSALERQILPFMTAPVTLFDYLSHCFTAGGVMGVLSLGGLFVLLRRFNVEYPDFFPRLYRLLEPSLFYVKHRRRFFELLALFLEGANLPLYMQAAFIKRFSRISLAVSPSTSMLLIALVYRVLVKHPAAHVLLHRTHNYDPAFDAEEVPVNSIFPFMAGNRMKALEDDPYDMNEPEPSKCRALESSLWEMKTLANHAVPSVATLAQLLFGSNELKMTQLNVTDFAEESYQSLFEQEHKRKTKNGSVNFQLPKHLFDKQTFSAYNFRATENLVAYQDSQLVQHEGGVTSSAIYQEKKKRKSFSELKADRKKKEASRTKRPRFAM